MAGKKIVGFLILLFSLSSGLTAQTKVIQVSKAPENFCVSEAEWKLYGMINEFRRQYDLPPIPLSRSLCYVANTHVKDLFFHHPDIEPCNFHSWSDKGPWKPFCYPGDEDKQNSVWDKPKELSGYPEKGFEIVYWENSAVVIDSVITFWKSFDYFNGFLMNTGKWQEQEWNAIGIGICQNFAAAWFGEVPDPEGVPYICGQKPPDPQPDTLTIQSKESTAPSTSADSVEQHVLIVPGKAHYYIIVKSQLSLKESEKVVQQLMAKDYKQAKVLQEGKKIRVSIFDTDDRGEALRLLKEAKILYKDAWLFKQ
ncbi:MAG: SPOR domain-containing protein [Bacteroidia bacterium]|nr:SPOR domain-containing protein [Bacteroidia bacterium]